MTQKVTSRKKAQLIAGAALRIKAKNVVILDMRKLSGVCSYFIIASGDSTTQLRAIADNIEKGMREQGIRLWQREGKEQSLWILLDYGSVVAHVFHGQTRGFYNLEKLWHDAPRIALPVNKRRSGAKKGTARRSGKKSRSAFAKKGAKGRPA